MIEISAVIQKKIFEKGSFRIYSAVPVSASDKAKVELTKYDNISILGEVHELTLNSEYKLTLEEDKRTNYGMSYRIVIAKQDIDVNSLSSCENFLREVLTEKQTTNILAVYPDFIKRVMNDEEVDITKIKGVGVKSFKKIKKKIIDNIVLLEFSERYSPYGISFSMIGKLYRKFKSLPLLEEKLATVPYRTLLEVDGVGFKTADDIVLKLNPDFIDKPDRMNACIRHALLENQTKGSTYIDKEALQKICAETTPECIHHFDKVLIESEYVHIDNTLNCVSLMSTFTIEQNIFRMILELTLTQTKWDCDYTQFTKVDGIELTPDQQSVAKNICDNNIYILGGVPGSGKTFSTKAVIDMCKHYKKKFLLFAPTGKASKVLADNVKSKASTIHQGLGFNPSEGFQFNEGEKLDCDIVIIDEFSMVDIFLMEAVLKAMDRDRTKLLLIGDFYQLPSVACGNVANDLVNSNVVPKTMLEQVFRYKEGGLSACVADLRCGKKFLNPKAVGCKQVFGERKDYLYFDVHQDNMLEMTKDLFMQLSQKESIDDIVILSTFNKGNYGTVAINKLIQKAYNKSKVEIQHGSDGVLKLGDKVMQIKNNYAATEYINEKTTKQGYIFNGSVGRITKIDEDDGIHVQYEDKIIVYEEEELDQLVLAYAISVHKSQGMSIPFVILITPPAHTHMLTRALLYVGLTRARQRVFHFGNIKTVNMAINKIDTKRRNTYLLHFMNTYKQSLVA